MEDVRGEGVSYPNPGHLTNAHLANGHLANGHLVNGHLANGHLANKCMGGHLANRQFWPNFSLLSFHIFVMFPSETALWILDILLLN